MEPDLDPPEDARAGAAEALELRVLGPIELLVGETLVPLAGRNQRAVLVALALHRGHPLSTERLVDLLWGEAAPRTAATSVQNTISQLRKLVGTEHLVTTSAGYVLGLTDQRFDAGRFEQLVAGVGAAEPRERIRMLDEALALWRGTPFAELEAETFVQEEQRRLEELRLVAVEERLDALIALDRLGEAIAELQSHVSRYPLRERPRAMLMLALYRAGRQADALRIFQETRAVLVDELGIEPGPELQELHSAVLRQERTLRPGRHQGEDDHFDRVARALLAGRLVPIVGAGVGGQGQARWKQGDRRAPSAAELAGHLVQRFGLPGDGSLPHVSELAAALEGVGALNDELAAVFGAGLEPSSVERFVATLPALARSARQPQPLIVTTELGSTLEHALAEAGEEVDVLTYLADGPGRGRFLHRRPSGETALVTEPNAYAELSFEARPVLLAAHGSIGAGAVVREDDHIDYLLDLEPAAAVPVTVAARLRRSHVLFLGYEVDDWSLRVFLRRIWGGDRFSYRSWAVAQDATRLARELWSARDVEVVDWAPAEYVEALGQRLDAIGPVEGGR